MSILNLVNEIKGNFREVQILRDNMMLSSRAWQSSVVENWHLPSLSFIWNFKVAGLISNHYGFINNNLILTYKESVDAKNICILTDASEKEYNYKNLEFQNSVNKISGDKIITLNNNNNETQYYFADTSYPFKEEYLGSSDLTPCFQENFLLGIAFKDQEKSLFVWLSPTFEPLWNSKQLLNNATIYKGSAIVVADMGSNTIPGRTFALEYADGHMLWEYPFFGIGNLDGNDRLVCVNPHFYAEIDIPTGQILVQQSQPDFYSNGERRMYGSFINNFAVYPKHTIVVSVTEGKIGVFDRATGNIVQTYQMEGSAGLYGSAVAYNDQYYVAIDGMGTAHVFEYDPDAL